MSSSSSSSSAAMSAPLLAPAGSSSWTCGCGRCSWFGFGRIVLLAVFAVVLIAHVVLTVRADGIGASITKCILAPLSLLVLWCFLAAPNESWPQPLLLALVFRFLGDFFFSGDLVGLPFSACFLVGMGAFACGHVCLVYLFVSRGAAMMLARWPYIAFCNVALVAALLSRVFAWHGIDNRLHFAVVPVYAGLLILLVSSSMACGYATGFGGLCFLASDSIILLTQASAINEDTVPWELQLLRTILYVVAIVVIAAASIRMEQASARAAALAAVPAADRSAKDIADAEIAVTASWPHTRIANERGDIVDAFNAEVVAFGIPHAAKVTDALGHDDNAGSLAIIKGLPFSSLRDHIYARLADSRRKYPTVVCGAKMLAFLYALPVAVYVSACVDYGIENQLNRWGVKGVHGLGFAFCLYLIVNAHVDRINVLHPAANVRVGPGGNGQ